MNSHCDISSITPEGGGGGGGFPLKVTASVNGGNTMSRVISFGGYLFPLKGL